MAPNKNLEKEERRRDLSENKHLTPPRHRYPAGMRDLALIRLTRMVWGRAVSSIRPTESLIHSVYSSRQGLPMLLTQ